MLGDFADPQEYQPRALPGSISDIKHFRSKLKAKYLEGTIQLNFYKELNNLTFSFVISN